MKAVMVMFDSLNRRFLPNYGCDLTIMPNFKRLGEKAVTFDGCYAGSLPCIPARRELHTGRYNFLHRSWGPIEPYDDSMPELLKKNHVHTHLCTDHYHYFEDGGATYHTRYGTWEAFRGQEGDPWKALLNYPACEHLNERHSWGQQDLVNRSFFAKEENMPQVKTFEAGLDFINANHHTDNWFLHIETFDPHEPYFVPEKYKALYEDDYQGPLFDWPLYKEVTETPAQVKHIRTQYMALLSMCDHYLGTVLDAFDRYDLWKDTMLIVNTDHGFLLGEHGWWAKCAMPFFNEIANIPLFMYDPRTAAIQGVHRHSLVQTIDLAPTLLSLFGVEIPKDMQGHDLLPVIKTDTPVRNHCLFGIHGGAVNITDGEYVYMHYPTDENKPLYEHTLMPTRHGGGRAFINNNVLEQMTLCEPFTFTKGLKLMKMPTNYRIPCRMHGTCLYDLKNDPGQLTPIEDSLVTNQMRENMIRLMKENDAPPGQYQRLGLLDEESTL